MANNDTILAMWILALLTEVREAELAWSSCIICMNWLEEDFTTDARISE